MATNVLDRGGLAGVRRAGITSLLSKDWKSDTHGDFGSGLGGRNGAIALLHRARAWNGQE